jgi:predicted ATP-dependent protease
MKQKTDKKITRSDFNLTLEQQKELEKAVEETYIEDNLISHEEAMKSLSRWLKK